MKLQRGFLGGILICASAMSLAALGCSSSDGGNPETGGSGGSAGSGGAAGAGGTAGSGGTQDCAAPAFDIAGTFNERYNCRLVDSGTCSGQDVATTVIIAESDNGVDYTFENLVDQTMGSGRLCGNEFEWTSMGTGFTEMGVWTFTDANNVEIETTFTGAGEDGECVAVATRDPAQPGPPPDLPCTPL